LGQIKFEVLWRANFKIRSWREIESVHKIVLKLKLQQQQRRQQRTKQAAHFIVVVVCRLKI